MNALRIFFIGGYLAYRALFNWIHWSMYVPTMLGGPIFQILFFAYIGRYAGLQSDEFFVIGNAVAISRARRDLRDGDDDRRRALDADARPRSSSRLRTGSRSSSAARSRTS